MPGNLHSLFVNRAYPERHLPFPRLMCQPRPSTRPLLILEELFIFSRREILSAVRSKRVVVSCHMVIFAPTIRQFEKKSYAYSTSLLQ